MGYRSFLTIQVTLYDHALPKSLKTKKYLFHRPHCYNWCFPGGLVGKEPVCNAGNVGLILGSERSTREGHDNPLQYSCLENPMDRGASQATVHRVAKSQTWLKWLSMHTHIAITTNYAKADISFLCSNISCSCYKGKNGTSLMRVNVKSYCLEVFSLTCHPE